MNKRKGKVWRKYEHMTEEPIVGENEFVGQKTSNQE